MRIDIVVYSVLVAIFIIVTTVMLIGDARKADACRAIGGHWLDHDRYCITPQPQPTKSD